MPYPMVRRLSNTIGTKEGLATVLSLLLLFLSNSASAQTPTMTLLNTGLAFGSNITRTKTIAYTNSNSAAFEVQFTNDVNAMASMTFILPTNLQDASGDNLPVSFASNSAAYNVRTNSTHGATAFDPSTGVINAAENPGAHNIYFWLGGTVTPGSNYVAATYSGVVTASAVVTVGANQYSASLDIPVTATLQGNVSLSATGTLAFGQIVAGTTPASLSALTTGAPEFIATSSTRSHNYTITYSSTQLSDGVGDALTFVPSLYGSAVNSQTGAASVASGSTVSIGKKGNYYFWLGGSLGTIPVSQPAGKYTGAFVVSITY
jgi:hypothetical protein